MTCFRMNVRLLFFTFLFTTSNALAVTQESPFDSIVRITKKELVSTDPEKALENIQYLYKISENDAQRLRSLNLKGGLLLYFGLRDEALKVFLESEKLAIKEKNHCALTSIYGYISAIYRHSNLISSSREYLTKAKEASKKIKNRSERYRYQGNIEHEIASIEADRAEYQLSLEHLRNAITYFKSAYPDKKPAVYRHLYNSYGMMSDIHLRIKDIDSSAYYLELAKKNLDLLDSKESRMEGNYYNSLAKLNLAQNKNKEAEENFLRAQRIAEQSKYFQLSNEIYVSLSDFYKKTEQEEKASEYANLHQKTISQQQASNEKVTNTLLKILYKEQKESEAISQRKSLIINLLIALSIILICLSTWFFYQKRKSQKKFQAYIQNLNENDNKKTELAADRAKGNSYISKEREQSILDSLNELEKSEFFLKTDTSLNVYASTIGVNQKYITYVIKQHWNTDFSNYINQLRIDYIVRLIKTNPIYLQYKISYLAELCGFSSHSRFSATFKKITGIPPSMFIAKVKKENKHKKTT